jgi:hypothetical protein
MCRQLGWSMLTLCLLLSGSALGDEPPHDVIHSAAEYDNPSISLVAAAVPGQLSGFSYMVQPGETAQDLTVIASKIAPISQKTMLLRRIAQATFCLPQNILGTLVYGLLQLTGTVVETVVMNEVTIVVTTAPLGASLGKYIVIHTSLQTENAIRHEYGHTMQGYVHGPFFLLLEGAVSFMQAAYSMISPSFAKSYYDRWPEDEANELAGLGKDAP